jgi:hypothetical protein
VNTMERLDRFVLLRNALPRERYSDHDVTAISDRCCELEFATGSLVTVQGQPVSEWLVVAEGQLVVERSGERFIAGVGALVQPGSAEHRDISDTKLVAVGNTTVLLVTDAHSDGPR